MKGMPLDTAKRLLISESEIEMAKHNKLNLLENPNRPGPDYYKDCNKFNWVNAMVKSHKKHITDKGEDYDSLTLTDEDLAWQAKMKALQNAHYLQVGFAAAVGTGVFISVI